MANVGTTAALLKAASTNRTDYSIQNKGISPVKFDFFDTIDFADDSGLILGPGESLALNGRMAKAQLYAVSGSGSNRVLIGDPGGG